MIQVLLYRDLSGPLSWWIRLRTGGPYSHAAFHLDDGSVWHATWPCVMRADSLRESVVQLKHPRATIDLYEMQGLRPWQRAGIIDCLLDFEGTKYDWWGLIHFMRRRDWHDVKKFFCSELVRAATDNMQVCYHLFDVATGPPAHKTSPNDLARSTRLRKVDTKIITL